MTGQLKTRPWGRAKTGKSRETPGCAANVSDRVPLARAAPHVEPAVNVNEDADRQHWRRREDDQAHEVLSQLGPDTHRVQTGAKRAEAVKVTAYRHPRCARSVVCHAAARPSPPQSQHVSRTGYVVVTFNGLDP